jgi:hypothetical protein
MAQGRRQSLTNSGNPSSSQNNATPLHSSGNASQSGAVVVSTQLSHQWYEVETIECPKDVSIGEDAKLGVEHRVNACKDG